MKLYHLNLTVNDVSASRQFLEIYFGLTCRGSRMIYCRSSLLVKIINNNLNQIKKRKVKLRAIFGALLWYFSSFFIS
jgi:hypothetical protein